MSIHTFTAEDVFAAVQRGDVLRRVRRLHPSQEAVKNIADAEAAAELSALLLENAYRQHQDNLARVNQARQALVLEAVVRPPVCPEPSPFEPAGVSLAKLNPPVPAPTGELKVVKTNQHQPDLLEGLARIDRVTPMSSSKSEGTLTMASGQSIRWTCVASYTDALAPLFAQVPVVVRGFLADDNHFSLTLIRAAAREEWDVPDAGRDDLMLLNQDTVTMAASVRKQLIRLHGPTCQACGETVNKSSAAAFQDQDRLLLLCHLCKALRMESVSLVKAVA